MIRIIYTWKVAPEKQDAFVKTWKQTTNHIHETIKGARGSFMLQNHEDPTIIKTIARWDSLEDWQQFWQDSKPNQMQSMHGLGKRTAVEVFQEIDDFTK